MAATVNLRPILDRLDAIENRLLAIEKNDAETTQLLSDILAAIKTEPEPLPAPEPTPEPTPDPSPEPSPEPTPTPDPTPSPEPFPEPTPSPGAKSLITQADFNPSPPLYYDVQTNGNDTSFAQGLAIRYVNGERRVLMWQHGGFVDEVALPVGRQAGKITARTNRWPGIQNMSHIGLGWDGSRLLTSTAKDYETNVIPVTIRASELIDGGTIGSVNSIVGLQGWNAKQLYGGLIPAPTWWTAKYPQFPFWCGWGGYTSLLLQGGGATLGVSIVAVPDPETVAANTALTSGQFMVVANQREGSNGFDWYGQGVPTAFDRGVKLTSCVNYYDGNQDGGQATASNDIDTRPTRPPDHFRWGQPAPDGLGRFVWGDSYRQTGMWIETPTREAFALIATVGKGYCWYANGHLNADSKAFELHLFDKHMLLDAAEGRRATWDVKPYLIVPLTLAGMGPTDGEVGHVNMHPTRGSVVGAAYDPQAQEILIAGASVNVFWTRIYVVKVQ